MPGETGKRNGQIALCYLIVCLIVALDQASKCFIGKMVSQGGSIPLINKVFHITLVHNTGAAFGIFRGHPGLFMAFAVLAIILIIYFLRIKNHLLNIAERTALCFILGGALGNLADRIRLGYVVDFIDLRVWPVFNFADTFITAGAVMLGAGMIVSGRTRGGNVRGK
ncbi:MAG: signal peptidase II [Candidatus Omnitrophota bacterium]